MTDLTATPNVLDAIVAATRHRVVVAKARESQTVLERRTSHAVPRGQLFRDRLARPGQVNVIAECKRRSPSRGVLRADYDPVAIAQGYERAGAAAVSVLTEPAFFDGALEHLRHVREGVTVPLLRKDFIVDEYQLYEALAAGADAVLLIVAALDDAALTRLHRRAGELGLAVLVEVHDVDEAQRAIGAGAALIGVNNRNLKTLAVDVDASRVIAGMLPADVVAVSESGLRTVDDIAGLQALGYRAFLIGERLMTQPNPGEALRQFTGERP